MTNNINETLKERGTRYGSFEDNAEITQLLMEVIEKGPSYNALSRPHKEAIHMIFHKIARCVCGDPDYPDNIHDIAGYAKLLEDLLIEKENIKKGIKLSEKAISVANDEDSKKIREFLDYKAKEKLLTLSRTLAKGEIL